MSAPVKIGAWHLTREDLEGREARCTCGDTRPSTDALDGRLAFFEFRGDGSYGAETLCKHCGYADVAHTPEHMEKLVHGRDLKRRPTVVERGQCPGFERRGDWGYDTFYCGHAGWD